MTMTSEEGNDGNSTTVPSKSVSPPMTHVSTDVLKEFMSAVPKEVKDGETTISNKDGFSDFDLPDLEADIADLSESGSNSKNVAKSKEKEVNNGPLPEKKIDNLSEKKKVDMSESEEKEVKKSESDKEVKNVSESSKKEVKISGSESGQKEVNKVSESDKKEVKNVSESDKEVVKKVSESDKKVVKKVSESDKKVVKKVSESDKKVVKKISELEKKEVKNASVSKTNEMKKGKTNGTSDLSLSSKMPKGKNKKHLPNKNNETSLVGSEKSTLPPSNSKPTVSSATSSVSESILKGNIASSTVSSKLTNSKQESTVTTATKLLNANIKHKSKSNTKKKNSKEMNSIPVLNSKPKSPPENKVLENEEKTSKKNSKDSSKLDKDNSASPPLESSENSSDSAPSLESLAPSLESSSREDSQETSPPEDDFLRPETPSSGTSSLEESLLKEDLTDGINEAGLEDDILEENLLLGLEDDAEEKEEPEKTSVSNDGNSPNLLEDIGNMKNGETSSSNSDEASKKKGEKGEGKKSDSVTENSIASKSTSSSLGDAVNNKNKEDSSNKKSTNNEDKILKPNDLINKDDSNPSASTKSLPVPDSLNNSQTGEKRRMSNDIDDGNMTTTKQLRKIKDKSKDKVDSIKSPSTENSKLSSLSFSEALKSIAAEDQMLIDDNRILKPTTEVVGVNISSTPLMDLQPLGSVKPARHILALPSPMAPNQTKKRPLSEVEEGNASSKPDLKKVRVFKANNTEDSLLKKTEVRKENSIKRGLLEVSKKVEEAKSMEHRLKEDKALESTKTKSDASSAPPKSGLVSIDEEELQRRTAQEMRKASLGGKKIKRVTRKELESLVIELFVDKVLYEHQLGQQKDLCKRLEATLEGNRKKAAQFHKEIEDLKKVTQRLQAEHLTRKSQVVAPVKVKRSVGIQATPTIIGKGLMHSSTKGNIRVLSASASPAKVSPPATSSPLPPPAHKKMTFKPTTSTQSVSSPPTSMPSMNDAMKTTQIQPNTRVMSSQPLNLAGAPSNGTATTQMLMVNPVMVQQPQNANLGGSSLLPVGATRLVRTPLTAFSGAGLTPSTMTSTPYPGGIVSQPAPIHSGAANPPNSSSSNVIDLTDEEEAAKLPPVGAMPSGSVLTAIQRPSGINLSQKQSGQFVALNTPSSVGQLVLVPSTMGQPTTALVVGNMPNSNTGSLTPGSNAPKPTMVQATPGSRFSTPSTIVNTTRVVVGAQMNGGKLFTQLARHPAPFPKAPPQQTSGYSKKLPPVPILKLSHKNSSIVLSWNMAKTDEHERIASYQLYAYQEGTTPPMPNLWKKVGSVKALELPMACTLTQFMPGHVYHFAVRAVDIRSRLGPFSDPRSIRLSK